MTIEIINRKGEPVEGMTWGTVTRDYGVSLTEAAPPDGEVVFRLVGLIYDDTGETNWRLYVMNEDGTPMPGVAAFMGIGPPSGTDLPQKSAPRLTEDFWGQPEGRPNRALVLQPNDLNFTNLDGYIQHSLGPGSNYAPPKPGGHWAWIQPGDFGYYSDVPAGFGMWGNHQMFWPVFQKQIEGNNGNGEPSDGDYEELVEQLTRLADAAESFGASMEQLVNDVHQMSIHWPFS